MRKRGKFDLDGECNFSELPPEQIETACMYEYMRESQALRDALDRTQQNRPAGQVLPAFVHQTFTGGEKYRLVLALLKAGFPKPWKALKTNARKALSTTLGEWEEEHKKSCPP